MLVGTGKTYSTPKQHYFAPISTNCIMHHRHINNIQQQTTVAANHHPYGTATWLEEPPGTFTAPVAVVEAIVWGVASSQGTTVGPWKVDSKLPEQQFTRHTANLPLYIANIPILQ